MIGTVCLPTIYDWVNSYIGNPVNFAVDSTSLHRIAPPMNFYERLENVIKINQIKLETHLSFSRQNEYVEKYIGPGYPDVLELQKDLSLVFLNYHHAIFGVRSLTPSVIPIAGVHIRDRDDPLPKVKK